jgi:hypothetical protein
MLKGRCNTEKANKVLVIGDRYWSSRKHERDEARASLPSSRYAVLIFYLGPNYLILAIWNLRFLSTKIPWDKENGQETGA